MVFKGWQKESLIEWPGKICTVVFLPGCNFRCPFCYNQDLVLFPEKLPDIDEAEILNYLKQNKNLLDGLMITGGEPTASLNIKNKISKIKDRKQDTKNNKQKTKNDLIKFIRKVKTIGLKIGLETNGSNPGMLENLIKDNLIDYVAMDIKAPLEQKKYQQLTGVKMDLEKIKRSIKIILRAKIDSEFRTTVIPGLLKESDILKIAREIKGAKRYCLQQFQSGNTLEKKLRKTKPYSQDWFEKTAADIRKYLTQVELGV